jgi:hypothetical protein
MRPIFIESLPEINKEFVRKEFFMPKGPYFDDMKIKIEKYGGLLSD